MQSEGNDFARFTNAGYRGMSNINNWELAEQLGVKKEELLNHLGRAELAANPFCVTMTEKRIKKNQNKRSA